MNDSYQKLLTVFLAEQQEHVEGIRAFLQSHEENGTVDGLEDAFRRAHSLKGAARAVGVAAIESLAHSMETVLARVRDGELALNPSALTALRHAMDAVEDAAHAASAGGVPEEPTAARAGLAQLLNAEPGKLAASPTPSTEPAAPGAGSPLSHQDMVRVRVEHVDRMIRSAGELLTESARQEGMVSEIQDWTSEAEAAVREWESMQTAFESANGASDDGETRSLTADDLREMDRRMRVLATTSRQMLGRLQRSVWALERITEQVNYDARAARTVPAGEVFAGFRKMVRDIADQVGKRVDFRISGLDVEADRFVLQTLKDPVMHALRNAVDHGIESPAEREAARKPSLGLVQLEIAAASGRLRVAIRDDGRGVDLETVRRQAVATHFLAETEAEAASDDELFRVLCRPGFSTSSGVTTLSGRGIGLTILHDALTRMQGQMRMCNLPTGGTELTFDVPLSVVAHQLVLVTCGTERYCIPMSAVARMCRVSAANFGTAEGRPIVTVNGIGLAESENAAAESDRQLQTATMPVVGLAGLLGMAESTILLRSGGTYAVIVHRNTDLVAVCVDEILGEIDGVIHDLPPVARDVAAFSGCVHLGDATVTLVLDVNFLADGAAPLTPMAVVTADTTAAAPTPPVILIVDDSITTRTLEKGILESQGYHVRVAVDGMDALQFLRLEEVDLVVADLQMPRLDGFGLLAQIKQDEKLARLPVIIVSSLESKEDMERGLSLGADAYIVKRKFDQRDLLDTIEQLL